MLCMIFYWQKFFYLKNIQRSFLVRCRLGKLAFFNNASLATLAIILQNITAQRCSPCHDGNPHAHNLVNHCRHCDLVLYLIAHNLCILCELTAHTVCCNMLYFITQITEVICKQIKQEIAVAAVVYKIVCMGVAIMARGAPLSSYIL